MGSLSQLMGVLRLSFAAVVFAQAVQMVGVVPWTPDHWWHCGCFCGLRLLLLLEAPLWPRMAHHVGVPQRPPSKRGVQPKYRAAADQYRLHRVRIYLPMHLVGTPVYVMISVGTLNLVYQFWVHTQHVKRLGILDYILVTPSNHRVHHAKNPHTSTRTTAVFLLFGIVCLAPFCEREEEKPVYGITHGLRSWNPIWANASVWWQTLVLAIKAPRWRDKVRIWFKGPGCSPRSTGRYP